MRYHVVEAAMEKGVSEGGIQRYRSAVLPRRYSLPGYTCTPEDVILTCGCSGALDLSLQAREAAGADSPVRFFQ